MISFGVSDAGFNAVVAQSIEIALPWLILAGGILAIIAAIIPSKHE